MISPAIITIIGLLVAVCSMSAAACSAYCSYRISKTQKSNLTYSIRPELVLTDWQRRDEGSGDDLRSIITFGKISNIGRGPAITIKLNCGFLRDSNETYYNIAPYYETSSAHVAFAQTDLITGEASLEIGKKSYHYVPRVIRNSQKQYDTNPALQQSVLQGSTPWPPYDPDIASYQYVDRLNKPFVGLKQIATMEQQDIPFLNSGGGPNEANGKEITIFWQRRKPNGHPYGLLQINIVISYWDLDNVHYETLYVLLMVDDPKQNIASLNVVAPGVALVDRTSRVRKISDQSQP
jgi:hypothetical protein